MTSSDKSGHSVSCIIIKVPTDALSGFIFVGTIYLLKSAHHISQVPITGLSDLTVPSWKGHPIQGLI